MEQSQQLGETNQQYWERVNQQKIQQEQQLIDYYNEQRRQLLEWEREAAEQARNEDAAFWAQYAEEQRKKEEEDRKAQAEFWIAYRKKIIKLNESSRPSNLNFGLL